jgi:hypothetical protein
MHCINSYISYIMLLIVYYELDCAEGRNNYYLSDLNLAFLTQYQYRCTDVLYKIIDNAIVIISGIILNYVHVYKQF